MPKGGDMNNIWIQWEQDYRTALERAQAQRTFILADFSREH
jgi:hypothetical protein